MKHIIIILFFVAMGFNCMAQDNKNIDNDKVNSINKELVNKVLIPMRKTAEQLGRDINKTQTLYNKLKDRRVSIATQPEVGEGRLKNHLEQLSFDEMFEEEDGKWFVKQDVFDVINNEPDSVIKDAYLLVIDMKESFNEPYNEESNNQFIKEAADVKKAILPGHMADFDKLVSQINDYNFYMFELARLFVAYDEDKPNVNPSEWDNIDKYLVHLLTQEDAIYLYDVPYTHNTLKEYIHWRGGENFPDNIKIELKTACPYAFPDF